MSIIGPAGLYGEVNHLHLLVLDPGVETCNVLGRCKNDAAALVPPGLCQGEAAHDVAGAPLGTGVGANQQCCTTAGHDQEVSRLNFEWATGPFNSAETRLCWIAFGNDGEHFPYDLEVFSHVVFLGAQCWA